MLGSYKLGIVNEAVLVLVVTLEDGVDHVLQLLVKEYLRLWFGLAGLWIMISLVVPVDERLDQLEAVQLVVTVSVVHLEVVKLQLLLSHL